MCEDSACTHDDILYNTNRAFQRNCINRVMYVMGQLLVQMQRRRHAVSRYRFRTCRRTVTCGPCCATILYAENADMSSDRPARAHQEKSVNPCPQPDTVTSSAQPPMAHLV